MLEDRLNYLLISCKQNDKIVMMVINGMLGERVIKLPLLINKNIVPIFFVPNFLFFFLRRPHILLALCFTCKLSCSYQDG